MGQSYPTVRIEDLAFGGDGLGRLDGKVCFIPGTAPGDLVEFRITKENKRFKRGEAVSIIQPGHTRAEPRCPFYGSCGGCDWQHITYDEQVAAKKRILAKALGLEDIEFEPSPAEFAYRQIARLHGRPREGDGPVTEALGFMERDGKTVVDISNCVVLEDSLNSVLSYLRSTVLAGTNETFEIRLTASKKGPAFLLVTQSVLSPSKYEGISDLSSKGFVGAAVSSEGVISHVFGEKCVVMEGGDKEPLLEPYSSFGQANRRVNGLLCDTVSNWIERGQFKNCLELFSGSGNLTAMIAPHVKQLVTVERDGPACSAARRNMEQRGFQHVRFCDADAADQYKLLKKSTDLIVLDPPRTGNLALAAQIARGDHQGIVYVSCNPATLSRDIKEMLRCGYRMKQAKGFDMFPQTSHMEAAVLLEK